MVQQLELDFGEILPPLELGISNERISTHKDLAEVIREITQKGRSVEVSFGYSQGRSIKGTEIEVTRYCESLGCRVEISVLYDNQKDIDSEALPDSIEDLKYYSEGLTFKKIESRRTSATFHVYVNN